MYFTDLRLSGILTALTQPSPDALRVAIRETKVATDKPFGVNITILPSINPPDYEGYARVSVEEGVRIFETAGNSRELCSLARSFVCIDARFQPGSSSNFSSHTDALSFTNARPSDMPRSGPLYPLFVLMN